MKKHKIATRVFKMISASLLILLSAQLIFQTLFLERFYIHTKKSSIAKETETLTKKLGNLPEDRLGKALRLFSQRFGAMTGIVNISGMPLYGFDSQVAFMEIETKEGPNYKIYLSHFLEQEDLIKQLKIGEQVSLRAIISGIGEDELYPSAITVGGKVFEPIRSMVYEREIVVLDNVGVAPVESVQNVLIGESSQLTKEQMLEGTIKELYIPGDELVGTGYRENKALEEIHHFIQETYISSRELKVDEPIIYESMDTYVGIRNIISIVPIVREGQVNFLISLTSLEQVEEAIGIMNQYTFIIFIMALIVAIFLAYWYAKKLTSPLVAIKDVTTHITNLDFSKTCQVQSQDEIGELAANINSMSYKLRTTLEKLQKDMAFKERINEERKQFIIDVSHELKTPLTVLKATCEGFRDDIYESQDKSYVQNMLYQIDAMSEMVQELLMIVRLEQEEQLQQEAFDLSDSILKIHAGVKALAKEKNIKIQMNLEESIVQGDRKKIETVIRNFYNNAIFYTSKNKSITITTEPKEDQWYCSIENEGEHIEEEQLQKIWEPFYRIDQSRNKALGGSGLGLYIIKKILDKHGSDYGLENTKTGVRAWFKLIQYK